MTYREMYENVINGTINEETVEMAKTALAKLDERNAKRASKPSKTAVANEPIKASIVEWLTANEGKHIASEIGAALNLTTPKASSLCGQMVKAGTLNAEEVKVPKVGKRIAYSLAQSRGKGRFSPLSFFEKSQTLYV